MPKKTPLKKQPVPNADDYFAGIVNGRKVKRSELLAAFNKVKPETHWKDPIEKIVWLLEGEKAVMTEAIIFFTGSVPEYYVRERGIPDENGRYCYCVRANGYYATIGA